MAVHWICKTSFVYLIRPLLADIRNALVPLYLSFSRSSRGCRNHLTKISGNSSFASGTWQHWNMKIKLMKWVLRLVWQCKMIKMYCISELCCVSTWVTRTSLYHPRRRRDQIIKAFISITELHPSYHAFIRRAGLWAAERHQQLVNIPLADIGTSLHFSLDWF